MTADAERKGGPVNHPPHYQHPSGVECIDVAEHMNFCRGNALKYLWRAGQKNGGAAEVEDLRKSRWYLDREIARLDRERPAEPSAMPATPHANPSAPRLSNGLRAAVLGTREGPKGATARRVVDLLWHRGFAIEDGGYAAANALRRPTVVVCVLACEPRELVSFGRALGHAVSHAAFVLRTGYEDHEDAMSLAQSAGVPLFVGEVPFDAWLASVPGTDP